MFFKNHGLLRCIFIMAACVLLVQFSVSPASASIYFSDSGSAIGIIPGHQYGRTYQSCIAEGYTDCEWPSSAFLYSANGYVCADNNRPMWYGYVSGSYWHSPTNYYLDSGGVTSGQNCITLSPGARTLSNQRDSTYIILQVGNSNSFVPNASFSGTPLSGTVPLVVQFSDTSVGSPSSWSWSFGDGNTSTLKNPSHTYTAAGTYSVSLTADNSYGSDTETKQGYVTATEPELIADFTASPLSGTAPLTVTFTDGSTGSPVSWSWDFGDSDSTNATMQNPVHTYASAGIYTVSLTATNTAGSDTETKTAYVTVTSSTVNYYVFSDGVRYYHNYENNSDVAEADTAAQYFFEHLTDGIRCHEYDGTNYCWNERGNPVNENTGSLYWSKPESADSIGANSADFAFHAGHGWEDGLLFGTANNYYRVFRANMSFSRTKWAAFDSCSMLAASNQTYWESVFDGLHILMGFDTIGQVNEDIGPQFVERMRGGTYQGTPYQVYKIRDAWMYTLKNTIDDPAIRGAYMWAEPCAEDRLPGYGTFCSQPTSDIRYYSFDCDNV
jgi:PKD repeat protein